RVTVDLDRKTTRGLAEWTDPIHRARMGHLHTLLVAHPRSVLPKAHATPPCSLWWKPNSNTVPGCVAHRQHALRGRYDQDGLWSRGSNRGRHPFGGRAASLRTATDERLVQGSALDVRPMRMGVTDQRRRAARRCSKVRRMPSSKSTVGW